MKGEKDNISRGIGPRIKKIQLHKHKLLFQHDGKLLGRIAKEINIRSALPSIL